MKLFNAAIFFAIVVLVATISYAGSFRQNRGLGSSWNNNQTFTQPYKHNAYGQGIHSDSTGKPFQWETQDRQITTFEKVRPNGYGDGIGMDIYGRPVKPKRWP
jgi:hypothetical protein